MKYIKFTYVDKITGVSVASEPAVNGPVFPQVAGLQYMFALQRKYPTNIPEFIGTCDDDADMTMQGIVKELSADELAYEQAEEVSQQSLSMRAERNQRLATTDWTQVLDAPVDRAAWADYRQALRDITAQAGFPWDVEWPTAP